MLLLVDSAGLYFRAYHAIPTTVRDGAGMPVNAVRGFLDMLAQLVASRRPTELVACWDDDWRPAWRVELLPSYKAQRVAADGAEDQPDDLGPQVEVIIAILAALGICRVGAAGFEADDVIATLARRHTDVEVVSGDRDLVQVIDDPRVRLLYVGAGMSRMKVMDGAAVLAAHGVRPEQYVDYSILRGDPSDGLPGVAGIGARTAATLLGQFPTMADLLAAAGRGDPAIRPALAARLLEAADYLQRAGTVVRAAEVPLPQLDARIPAAPADPGALESLAAKHNLRPSVSRLTGALFD